MTQNNRETEELNLLIKLKYGEISSEYSWLDTLPSEVLLAASKALWKAQPYPYTYIYIYKTVISIMLRQSANRDKAKTAIQRALLEYHRI